MKHISILSLIFLLIVATGTNCKKALFGEKLPPATQEGKNTCGFLVNGKVWLPRGDNGFANLSCSYDETYNGGTFNINGYRYETGANNSSSFAIGLYNMSSTGLYKLNLDSSKIATYSTDANECFLYEWYDTVANHNAYINITKLDKQKRIISGSFEYALTRTTCGIIIRITQGRFDMKY